jgi:hypothetical protein
MYNGHVLSKHFWRLFFAVLVLVTSLAVLAWSFLPGARIVRRQKIQPTEMQLPTPGSFIVPSHRSLAWLDHSIETACVIHGADRFVLLN